MTYEKSWIPIDPDTVEDDPPAAPDIGLVLVRITPDSAERTGPVLLELGRRWRDQGRRVFICDACFELPFLHSAADLPNGEGLSDALVYGTSFQRIAHRFGRGLHVATAGTVVPDPEGVRAHSRWTTLLDGFREAHALLVVAVPAAPPEASALALADAPWFDLGSDLAVDLDALAEADSRTPDPASRPDPDQVEPIAGRTEGDVDDVGGPPRVRPRPPRELAMVGRIEPTVPRADESGADSTPPESPPTESVDASGSEPDELADFRAALAETRSAREAERASKRDRPGLVAKGPRPTRRTGTGRILLMLALLILVVVLGAAWFGFIDIPGFPIE